MKGRILSINISTEKGVKKTGVPSAKLKKEHGIIGDAHTGTWHRQVSLLANESVEKMRGRGMELNAGDFAENITTEGIEVNKLPIGTNLRIGKALLEVTQIGKECHQHCAIYHQVGDCVMPREGIFVKVLEDGDIAVGDEIEVIDNE